MPERKDPSKIDLSVIKNKEKPPLTKLWEPEAPANMYEKSCVEDGRLVVETPQGRMMVEIVALPSEEGKPKSRFFSSRLRRNQEAPVAPVSIAISPRIPFEQFDSSRHTPAMGRSHYAVLESGTTYGIRVTLPASFTEQEWGPTQTELQDHVWENGQEYKVERIFREKHGAGVAARTDKENPLARTKTKGITGIALFVENLIGVTADGGEEADLIIAARRTNEERLFSPSPDVGESKERSAISEPLVFQRSDEQGIDAAEQGFGDIAVIVYDVVFDETSEMIRTPVRHQSVFMPTRGNNDFFGGGFRGSDSFAAGRTEFGKPQKTKVNITGVSRSAPVAAFALTLVVNDHSRGLEMAEAPEILPAARENK